MNYTRDLSKSGLGFAALTYDPSSVNVTPEGTQITDENGNVIDYMMPVEIKGDKPATGYPWWVLILVGTGIYYSYKG